MHSCWTAGRRDRGGGGGVRRAEWARRARGRSRAEAQIWRDSRAKINFSASEGDAGRDRDAARRRRVGRTLGGVLEAAIHDGAEEFGLEQEIAEAGGVDADVALLHSLASLGARGVGGSLLLLLVIEELLLLLDGLFVGHLAREKRGVTSDDACDRGARVLSDARNADRALDTIRDDGIASPRSSRFRDLWAPIRVIPRLTVCPYLFGQRAGPPRVSAPRAMTRLFRGSTNGHPPSRHSRGRRYGPRGGGSSRAPRTRARGPRGCPRGRRAHARPPSRGARDRLPRRGDAGVGARRAAKGSRAAPRVSGGQVARGGCASRAAHLRAARRGVDLRRVLRRAPASSPAADAELRAAREEVSRLASICARAQGRRARLRARRPRARRPGPSALADRAARVSLSGVSAELAAAREELDASARRHAARLAEVQSSFGAKLRDVRRVHAAQLASAVEAARAEHADTLKDARTTATAAKAKAKAALDAARRRGRREERANPRG